MSEHIYTNNITLKLTSTVDCIFFQGTRAVGTATKVAKIAGPARIWIWGAFYINAIVRVPTVVGSGIIQAGVVWQTVLMLMHVRVYTCTVPVTTTTDGCLEDKAMNPRHVISISGSGGSELRPIRVSVPVVRHGVRVQRHTNAHKNKEQYKSILLDPFRERFSPISDSKLIHHTSQAK